MGTGTSSSTRLSLPMLSMLLWGLRRFLLFLFLLLLLLLLPLLMLMLLSSLCGGCWRAKKWCLFKVGFPQEGRVLTVLLHCCCCLVRVSAAVGEAAGGM